MRNLAIFCVMGLLSTGAFAQIPSRAECRSRISVLEKILKAQEDRFNLGEVDSVELAMNRLDLLDLRLACAEIRRDEYCAPENRAMINNSAQALEDEWKVGQRDYASLKEILLRKAAMDGICQ